MMTHADQVLAVAQAEDTADLLNHIAWTDVVKPKLEAAVKAWSTMLVNEAMGIPLPAGLTREQIAGKCFGVSFISGVLEKVLKDGEKALADLNASGFSL